MTTPNNDPQRPPRGPAGVGTPLPPVILVQPEIIAALNRIAAAFEDVAAAIAPDDEPIAQCRAEVHRQGHPKPYRCTRSDGHDGAHLARVDGVLLACEMCTGDSRRTVGMVCQTCGTDYAQEEV